MVLRFILISIFTSLFFSCITSSVFASEKFVNVPHVGPTNPSTNFVPDIFWFGQVTPTANYADVRSWYFDNEIHVILHIIDRRLFTTGERVSLYISVNGISYRFDRQLWSSGVSYKNTGTGWVQTQVVFTSTDGWRGNSLNDNIDDKGWLAEFAIPFTSIGLSSPPVDGTEGKIGIVLYDRDDAAGSAIPNQIYPEAFDQNNLATWSTLRFGRPIYSPAHVTSPQTVTIRQGLNGVVVPDAHVGGHTICGGNVDYWTEWGLANYSGYDQMNIQNQWDIADYPCFSKYYITFPLDQLPIGKEIVSGTVRLTLFGNAGGGQFADPIKSAINAIVVDRDFTESSVNWNNGPLAQDTISTTWVNPVQIEPASPYDWDVSRAVADAYEKGEPLRLAFYSTDGEYHSGKYFWTSNVEDWNAVGRPTLTVVLGDKVATNLPGDINGNGNVNLSDLSILLSNFGKQVQIGDVNGDGSVDLSDLSILLSNFGKSG